MASNTDTAEKPCNHIWEAGWCSICGMPHGLRRTYTDAEVKASDERYIRHLEGEARP